MAEHQETVDEDLVMLPATFDFETTLAGDSSSDDDDLRPMPEADMGQVPEVEVTPGALPDADMGQLPLDHESHDAEGKNTISGTGQEIVKKSSGRIEVVIQPLPLHIRAEYIPVRPGYEVYKVLGRIPAIPGESWWNIEYEDGRLDQVRLNNFS